MKLENACTEEFMQTNHQKQAIQKAIQYTVKYSKEYTIEFRVGSMF